MNPHATPKEYNALKDVVTRISDDLNDKQFVLLFGHNGTGKTRLSMEFKEIAKQNGGRDTLYFNAFTEDLFWWDNDLDGDAERYLNINSKSAFFEGFKELEMETRIFEFLRRYADYNFRIDYETWRIVFYRDDAENIKISRGEQNQFIWCVYLTVCQLVIDGQEAYDWVKTLYIDDPVSSLDDSNVIAIACDLAGLLRDSELKAVISTHHSLFFNVMYNELKGKKCYYYHRSKAGDIYTLTNTDDLPFFHHVALLAEVKKAIDENRLFTYHFNVMRNIMEKTAAFFGLPNFQACIHDVENEARFNRAVQLYSHGGHSLYEPRQMGTDNVTLFADIYDSFMKHYAFRIPELEKKPEATNDS